MKNQIVLAIVILLASCGAGAIARSSWYNAKPGYPAMPWVKGGSPKTTHQESPPPANDNGNIADAEGNLNGTATYNGKAPDAGNANDNIEATAPGEVVTRQPPAKICGCDHRVEGFCVAEIDCVLKHLGDQTAYLIDAREDGDYNEARLVGAIHIPSSAIYDNIENVMAVVPTKQDMLIVYCGGGQCEASKNVGIVLRDFEYTNVWLYEKGWEEVEASGKFGDYIEIGG